MLPISIFRQPYVVLIREGEIIDSIDIIIGFRQQLSETAHTTHVFLREYDDVFASLGIFPEDSGCRVAGSVVTDKQRHLDPLLGENAVQLFSDVFSPLYDDNSTITLYCINRIYLEYLYLKYSNFSFLNNAIGNDFILCPIRIGLYAIWKPESVKYFL